MGRGSTKEVEHAEKILHKILSDYDNEIFVDALTITPLNLKRDKSLSYVEERQGKTLAPDNARVIFLTNVDLDWANILIRESKGAIVAATSHRKNKKPVKAGNYQIVYIATKGTDPLADIASIFPDITIDDVAPAHKHRGSKREAAEILGKIFSLADPTISANSISFGPVSDEDDRLAISIKTKANNKMLSNIVDSMKKHSDPAVTTSYQEWFPDSFKMVIEESFSNFKESLDSLHMAYFKQVVKGIVGSYEQSRAQG